MSKDRPTTQPSGIPAAMRDLASAMEWPSCARAVRAAIKSRTGVLRNPQVRVSCDAEGNIQAESVGPDGALALCNLDRTFREEFLRVGRSLRLDWTLRDTLCRESREIAAALAGLRALWYLRALFRGLPEFRRIRPKRLFRIACEKAGAVIQALAAISNETGRPLARELQGVAVAAEALVADLRRWMLSRFPEDSERSTLEGRPAGRRRRAEVEGVRYFDFIRLPAPPPFPPTPTPGEIFARRQSPPKKGRPRRSPNR